MKEENIVETILTSSGAAVPKAGPELELLKSAMMKYFFIRDTSFSDDEDEYELDTGSNPTENVDLALADLPYSTRSAWGQSNSAHDVFSKRDVENVVRLVGSVVAPGAHAQVLCSDLKIYQRNKSSLAAKEEVDIVGGDLEGQKKSLGGV